MLYPVVLVQLPQEADAKKDQAFETLESLLEENGKEAMRGCGNRNKHFLGGMCLILGGKGRGLNEGSPNCGIAVKSVFKSDSDSAVD